MKLSNDVKVQFAHLKDKKGNLKSTKCRILKGDHLVGYGISYKHKNDVFEKPIGRKVSFKRALMETSFNKEIRTQLWTEYFSYVKK